VLIVEDAPDARESLRALLEVLGHRVRCAEDGVGGVEAALAWMPDIAIVNIGLPGIDGYEVARRVRRGLAGRAMYLVALTGYSQAEDRRLAMESGFDEHLVKPLAGDELRRVVAMSETSRLRRHRQE
jgi:CheY-like chemotaxis protein